MNIKQVFFTIIFLLTIISAKAQISGDWKGALNVHGNSLDLIFHITENNEAYTATLDVPAQGASGIRFLHVLNYPRKSYLCILKNFK